MDKMTANDLVAMLLNIPDEDGITEFKRLGLELRISKVVETIVAMANTDGGIITQSIARIIKHSCNWRAIKGRVDDHNSLIYKQIPANLWPARKDAIEQLRAKAG